MKLINLLPLLSGCILTSSNTVTPIGPSGWEDTVQEAIDVWEQFTGCEMANIGNNGDHISVVPVDDWTHPGYAGWSYYWGDIEIIETSYTYLPLLLHEFGHRIGLYHSNDITSVMYTPVEVYEPNTADIIRARFFLCGEDLL